ncbi:hypothetical protein Syun_014416 [Stephania yunnanensis]|uniref:O-fucosyltransferase family protein n=1 Tax=Stephania yunnanensis TaxID=152371 RepID=A0AAP0PBW1_9MAGN
MWVGIAVVEATEGLEAPEAVRGSDLHLHFEALGAPRNARIYYAGGEPFGGTEALEPLKREFPNMITKEALTKGGELDPCANRPSTLAMIDYIVSLSNDVFMPYHGGNMGSVMQGQRTYSGHMKFIMPNKRAMVPFFENKSLLEEEFGKIMKQLHKTSMKPLQFRKYKRVHDVITYPVPKFPEIRGISLTTEMLEVRILFIIDYRKTIDASGCIIANNSFPSGHFAIDLGHENFLLGEIFSQDPLRASDKALTSCGPYKMKEDDAMVYRSPYLTSVNSPLPALSWLKLCLHSLAFDVPLQMRKLWTIYLRALDVTLKWMDLSDEECTIESAKKMAGDVVNFLSGKIFPMTTTITATTTATTTSAPVGPSKESQLESMTTQSRSNDVPPS